MTHGNHPEQLIGSILAHRFAIESMAGEGGMGVVFKARDITDNRAVALKLLHRQSATATLSEPSRFFREAQLLSELRHPGIVSYVAHGQTSEGQLYLAMEWLSGHDLGKRLSQGTLSLTETLTLCRTIADALASAHRVGIVHRDLKPSNLFLRDGQIDQVTLFDFGIAQRHRSEPSVSRTGVVVGTPEYMAPEQARGERSAVPATDIFALACIVYACLTGRPPFVGEHVAALLTKILFEEPPRLRTLYPAAPEALDALLVDMLAKDAAARPTDASALLPIVDELLRQVAQAPGRLDPRAGHAESLSLYLFTVAASGERKSSTVKAMSAPIFAYQTERVRELLPAHAEYQAEREGLEAEYQRALQDRKQTMDKEKRREAIDRAAALKQQLAELKPPPAACFIAQDATPEGLTRLMSETGGFAAIVDSEGGDIFENMIGRYGKDAAGPNIGVYLKGYDGEPVFSIRASKERQPALIERAALSIVAATQPATIATLGKRSELRDRGLVARMLFGFCLDSRVGSRSPFMPAPDAAVKRSYEEAITAALRIERLPTPYTVALSTEAQRELWTDCTT